MKEINLFDSTQQFWSTDFSASPALYLGMHNRQLYVQENTELYKSLDASPRYMQHTKYPWQPHPAIGMRAWFYPSLNMSTSIILW